MNPMQDNVLLPVFFLFQFSNNSLSSWELFTGGIIGLGEAEEDRVGLLHTLSTLPTHPESVPINALIAVKGTPLQDQKVS
jgi:biotin synthase-like enzyme